MIDPGLATLLGFGAIFGLIILHVPVGIAMAVVGVVGFGLMIGWSPALSLLATEPVAVMSNLDLAVIPLFLLMGNLAARAGLASDVYKLFYAFIGHRRGGLSLATFAGCAGFGAVCGSAVATTVTFGRVALPEMLARGYSRKLAAGTVAAGGTLGIVVPPSSILIIYAILTEQFILDLFSAAIIPSALALLLYLGVVAIIVHRDPQAGPAGPRQSLRDRLDALRGAWTVLLLGVAVLGGVYSGVFTVTEAAAVGVAISFVLALLRKLNMADLVAILEQTATTTVLVYVMIIGASIFGYFLTITGAPALAVQAIQASGLPPLGIVCCILLAYLALGAIFDELAAMVLTLPFVAPVIAGLGYDLVWWGIVNIMVVTVGMMSPPIGMNVFVLNGLRPDLRLGLIYRGVAPFMAVDLLRLAVLVLVPGLSLWLPALLR
ncbi:MAG: TRAP transporter large permease [Cohaesibacteraceae bacterium]